MDTSAEAAAELGRRIGEELEQRGLNQAWLAAQVDRSPSSISKLVSGSWLDQGGVGSPLVVAVEQVLGFADAELLTLYRLASKELPQNREADPANHLDLRAPREVLNWSLMLDAWLRRLRCYLVFPTDSRDDQTFGEVRKVLSQAGAEVIGSRFPWDVYEGDERERQATFEHECARADSCDLAILLISQAHAQRCGYRRSTLEAFVQDFCARNLPSIVYALPDACAYAYGLKTQKGFERNVVDRLYNFDPPRLAPLTYFRVVETPSVGALTRDLLRTISSLTAASLSNIRAMGQVAWNDNQLTEREARSDEVWVVTPDFYYELEDSTWREILIRTILQGGRYRWLFPDTQLTKAETLFRRVGPRIKGRDPDDALEFFGVDEANYPWWPQLVVYDPTDPDRREAFLYDVWDRELPLSCNQNYRLSVDRAVRLTTEFGRMCTEDRRVRFRIDRQFPPSAS